MESLPSINVLGHDLSPSAVFFLSLTSVVFLYIGYQRFFSPLSKYPGPFTASLTSLWRAKEAYYYRLGETYATLHPYYNSSVIRTGPNTLNFNTPQAAKDILGGGPSLLKTNFYSVFIVSKPNLFMSVDEDFHRLRRRQLGHIFSMPSILTMEEQLERPIKKYRLNGFEKAAESGKPIDIKAWDSFLVIDVLWELAFGNTFGMTDHGDASQFVSNDDRLFIQMVIGQTPSLIPFVKNYGHLLPVPWVRRSIAAFEKTKHYPEEVVGKRWQKGPEGNDFLGHVMRAKDPETAKTLTQAECQREAYGFVAAGTHTTATTLTFLIYELLHNPRVLETLIKELDANLAPLPQPEGVYPFAQVDATKLPYLDACIKENHRKNGVFDMPLPRIVPAGGLTIDGHFVPGGVEVSISNFAIHHNPKVWGEDHDRFRPERWLDQSDPQRLKRWEAALIPFSTGHRSCIGRNVAATEIPKVVSTLFRNYHIVPVDPSEPLRRKSVGIAEKDGPLMAYVTKRSS